MALSILAEKLRLWLSRYKISASELLDRIPENNLRGSFTAFLNEVAGEELGNPGEIILGYSYDTSLILSWDNVDDVYRYRAQYSFDPLFISGVTTATSPNGDNTITLTGLTPSTQYYVRVAAITSDDADDNDNYWSPVGLFSTEDILAAPSIPIATDIADTTLTLTWGAVTGATGYVVQRSATANGTYVTVAGGTVGAVTTLAVTGLTADTDNYFKVYATKSGFTTITKSVASALAHTTE